MPWYEKIVPETVKKSVCAYLLQRYLGQFFEEKLRREQLSLDLYNGTGSVEKITLDVKALNDLGEKQNWPFEFIDGFIERLNIVVPWSSILKDSSYVEVDGLKLTLQPKQRKDDVTSMFESMWNSMSSSIKLAEECTKQDTKNSGREEQGYEGLELFAKTIDSILSRVKVKFINTVLQIEHIPKDSSVGIGIYINIDLIEYSDEAGSDPPAEDIEESSNNGKKSYVVQTFSTKIFNIGEITVSTLEFSSKARTFSRSMTSSSEDLENDLFKEMPSSPESVYYDTGKLNDDDDEHIVPFAKFTMEQEIRVSLKQSDNVSAPKVSINVNLGPFLLYLSPRQVHVLLKLFSGFASPDKRSHSNMPQKARCMEKPMTAVDYQRIENDLQQQMQPHLQVGGLKGLHGWSSAPFEDSDSEESFLPMKNVSDAMFDSTMSIASSSMESSYSSNYTGSTSDRTSNKSRRRSGNVDFDPNAEISQFQIQFTSLSAILLHEDLLNVDPDTHTLIGASVQQMKSSADTFFEILKEGCIIDKDIMKIMEVLDEACSLNHIRIIATPVHLEAHEKTTLTSFYITGQVTIAQLEVIECLCENTEKKVEYVPLMKFQNGAKEKTAGPIDTKPPLVVTFKHVEKVSKSLLKQHTGPKTDINFYFGKCIVEIDITIIDRITALLNPSPICIFERKTKEYFWHTVDDPLKTTSKECCTEIKILSPHITAKLRFPIPDYRPAHDLNRVPWWQRHIRQDFLTLVLTDFTFQSVNQTNQIFKEYMAQCRSIEIFYYETENRVPYTIAKTGCNERFLSSLRDVSLYPRVSVKIYPKNNQPELEEQEQEDIMTQSMYFCGFTPKDNGPFSSKKVVHESDTPHEKQPHEETAELIIPGDKKEIEEFLKIATDSSSIHIEIVIPTLSMQFVSKHMYELIYNRINNDLLMWESTAPKPKVSNSQIYDVNFGVYPPNLEIFSTCKSGVQYESESDSDDISEDGAILFHSTVDRQKSVTKLEPPLQAKKNSYLSINFKVLNGQLSFHTPVRDMTTNNVIPNQKSEFLFGLKNMSVFIVNGYKGDKDLGYICVQIGNAQMYHCDMMPSLPKVSPLREIGDAIEKHLHPTIYKSEKGALVDLKNGGGHREMVTVAVKIEARHETHHVKTVRIAVGLNKSTLQHRVCNEPNTWISQIMDFFKADDYPIPGYNSKEVLTELHIHMWDCAIDYRPLYLPLRSAITMGYFSMTSHLSAKSNTSILRFITEDCCLFLSDKNPPKNSVPSKVPIDLKRDYINVISLGLFELSLKINDKKSHAHPHVDLRASNDCIHFYTCSDSGRCLAQLITYVATYGDLKTPGEEATNDSAYSSPRHHATDAELISIGTPQEISKLTASEHQMVADLISEAIDDTEEVTYSQGEGVTYYTEEGAKLFFFPDEGRPPPNLLNPLPTVMRELGDFYAYSAVIEDDDSDGDFCIIGDEAGLGMYPKNGIPEIRWLTSDVVRIVENHFYLPVGKRDLLKTPKGFPTPKYKYTLCEMNIIWHLYGGYDFNSAQTEKEKKTKVNFNVKPVEVNENRFGDAVSYSNSGVSFSRCKANVEEIPWKIKGGANRDHKVLMEFELKKVKFQHEIYPETTRQASRQVLLISEFEIRDLLASSEFNKFLYLYTSEARPKQSQAHMLVIKAIHIRPDPKLTAEECCLLTSLLPLRLNIDQDSLKFLITFFIELGGNVEKDEFLPSSKHNTPTHHPPPVMTISGKAKDFTCPDKRESYSSMDEDLLLMTDDHHFSRETKPVVETPISNTPTPPIYFRSVRFTPEVPIKIDYKGKHIDMADNSIASFFIGLVMGVVQLNCSEIRLKGISSRHGILGFDKLVQFFLQEWSTDIRKNQVPNLLIGVGPFQSLVQLFTGVRDLFWLPIEQYQKDGRVVRGLQKGGKSFTTCSVMAALELTSRFIQLIQVTAETAYDMLSPGPSVKKRGKIKGRKKRYQPQDLREGVTNALLLMKEGIGETAGTIVEVASLEREQKGYSGAVGGVLRQIPPTIIKPIILATEATGNVLGGMKYQLLPDARKEANQKWRNE